LSGGIDSTSVTKNLYEVLDRVDTFSIVQKNPKYDEEKWVDFVAHKYNANQEKVNISNDIFQNEITHSISAFDEPYADPSSVLTYILSKEISKKYKVAISGDGGDELLGGYERFQNSLIKRSILNNLYSKLHSFQPYFLGTGYKFSKYSGDAMKSYFSTLEDTKFSNFLGFEKNNYLNESPQHKNIDLIKKLMINEYKFFLSEMMLVKIDRASMANSLEVRSPFLDHKLIEYVASTDLNNVITSNPKKPLKLFLASDFDNEFLSRKKMGFSFDIESWIYKNISNIEEEINDGYLMNLLGNKKISSLKNFRTRINSHRIWKILFIEKYLSNL
jgi:asparagine synthase (glutamine-hydrolysing)